MAVFITGDTHGDFRRFRTDIFYEQKELTKEDIVLICGDFGLWDDSPSERYWLNWLEDKPFTTAFVSGNHENYELLATFPVQEWHGGQAQLLRPSVLHLMRGQMFGLCGKRFFTMGGASSHDIEDGVLEPEDPQFKQKYKRLTKQGALFRVNHRSWWKEELPSQEEYQTARATLERYGWETDYIITHCCPTSVQDALSGGMYQADELTDFFDEVRQKCQFKYWFFGHYHENTVVWQKYVLLYEQIIKLK